jgi:exonuclease VII small subunit
MMSRSGPNHARMIELHEAASRYERAIKHLENTSQSVPKSTKGILRKALDEINVGLHLGEMCRSQIESAEELLDKVRAALCAAR